MEVGELTWRMTHLNKPSENEHAVREDLDLVEEIRNQASLREIMVKQRMATRFNKNVIPREFEIGDLDLRRVDTG